MRMLSPGTAAEFGAGYNSGFAAGLQKFELLIWAVFGGLLANYIAQGVISRIDLSELNNRQALVLDTLESASLQFSFTVALYLVLVLEVFGRAIRVAGGAK